MESRTGNTMSGTTAGENMMSDEAIDTGVDIQVPDIPMPSMAEDKSIKDTFNSAFKLSFIGAGQGGSRLALAFHQLGYRRVCCINTAPQDLATIPLPEANKLCIGGGGAGKDPGIAAKIYNEKREDVLDFMKRGFGPDMDRIFVCVSAGGGTGNGCAMELIKTAHELAASLRKPIKVGVIVALPKNLEGRKVCINASRLMVQLIKAVDEGIITPLIILDNERIESIYPGLAVDPFWNTANRSIASLFHLFNTIAIQSSHYTAFDQKDFESILNSGLIIFGATPVTKWSEQSDISFAVRDNLQRNLLAGGIDLSTGNVAGAIIIGSQAILNQVPQANIDHAFEQLSRLLKGGNTIHRGIYRGNKENLVVYTMVGGLAQPKERIDELAKLGGV